MSENSMLFANNLTYTLPNPVSVATNRVMKKQYFQNRRYDQEQTATCQWNTGVDLVDPKDSTLVFKFKVNSDDDFTVGFGTGSAANFLKNIRIYHRSGTTYTNTQNLNLFRKTSDRFNMSYNWFQSVGSLMRYDEVFTQDDGIVTCVIPLNHLHPFFEPLGDVLIPSVMASGLRVEIDLASLSEVFQANLGAPTSYEITDIYFDTCSVSLMDSAQSSLNTNAQQNSLDYLYMDVFSSVNSHPSDTNAINIDINKSVTFCQSAIACLQYQDDLNNLSNDSFKTSYLDAEWWYRLGSLQFPNQKINDPRVAYHNSLLTFDKLKDVSKPSSVDFSTFTSSNGIYSVCMERDSALLLSQSPVNASRALRFEASLEIPPTQSTLITIFMTYVTSARSSLLNSRVDI